MRNTLKKPRMSPKMFMAEYIGFRFIFLNSVINKRFILKILSYSYLSASTGFLVAAFKLCQLTASDVIPGVNSRPIPQISH